MEKNFFGATFFVLIFVFAILSSGCDNPFGEEPVAITLPKEYTTGERPVGEKTDIDVYLDATVSMKGYTTLGAGNVYRTLPDILTDIGSSMGEVKFYKFGAEVSLLENRDYRKFSSPEPYVELVTAVQNVVDKADPSHLTIIVTDLFESDSDWSNISKKIREKYFENHLAVAVIGIRNSFDGEIFDVGLNAAKFQYNSYNYPYRYRPFYLLVMGRESDINKFAEKFKERQTLDNEMHYLLLSEHLDSATNDFSSLPVSEMQNFFSDNRLKIEDKGVKELGADKFSEPAFLKVQFTYNPQPGTCPLNMAEIVPDVKVFSLEGEEWQPVEVSDVNLEMMPVEDRENTFTVTLSMIPEHALKEGKLNFVHAALAPSEKGYLMPQWVSNWNMANVDVDANNFNGAKTINLIHVIGSLKDYVFAAARPGLINMNFVVDLR